jgi:outer membrane protein assembly factor BamB
LATTRLIAGPTPMRTCSRRPMRPSSHSTGATTRGGYIASSPAVVNGVLYFSSPIGNVYALNARTGTTLWSYPTGSIIYSSPTVAHGVVYFGSIDGTVSALDAKTGTRLWSYVTRWSISSSPAVANGVLYIGSGDGNMYAFHLPGTQP